MITTTDPRLMKRLHRLLALVKRGESGERENAARLLDRALRKHGMALGDLEDELHAHVYKFNTKSDEETTLLRQILGVVLEVSRVYVHGRRRLSCEMTTAQHAEFIVMWEIYLREWRKESSRTLRAFFTKNSIFPDIEDEDKERPEYTDEEIEEMQKILDRAEGLEKINVFKQLHEGTRS